MYPTGNYTLADKIKLETPDALVGATSLIHGDAVFITNDQDLANALPESSCIYLRDIALEWLAKQFPMTCVGENDSVVPTKSGKGLPTGLALASLELGSIRPDPSAKWQRILKDSLTVASAVNESCAFFVLSSKQGRKVVTQEILFWDQSLSTSRPSKLILRQLKNHLEVVYDRREGRYSANPKKSIHAFIFISLARERAKLAQPRYLDMSDRKKESEAWWNYLLLLQVFRACLDMPQITWLLCEDGKAHIMDVVATVNFLDKAGNVLGWKAER